MTSWRCTIVTADGRQDVRRVEAPDQPAAVARLLGQGLTPIDVRSGRVTVREALNRPVAIGGKLRVSEQALLLTQLATLVGNGLPVDRSLDLLRDQAPRARQRDVILQILQEVRGGSGLATGFNITDVFPGYVTGVVRAAEQGGGLGHALRTLADRVTRAATARQQLITALTYPAAVLAATVLALMLVLTTVVPQFMPMIEGEENRLPLLTRFVVGMSRFALDWGMTSLMLFVMGCAGLLIWLRGPAGGETARRHRHRFPGSALRDQFLAAQFTGILGTLLENGLTVVAALPLVASAIGSRTWAARLRLAERRVREGNSLSQALAEIRLVPSTAVRLIEVGENTGKLALTCQQASDIIASGARARLDRIVSLANPIAIVSLGGLVGMLVAGVMLGIFAVGDFAG